MSGGRESEALRALAHGEGLARAVAGAARPGAGIREMTGLLDRVRTIAEGTGPELARVLADALVTDVLLNSGAAWVDRGSGLERLVLDLGGEEGVRALAVRMAAACGRRLDDASPIVDGTLPGGVRLHAVLAPPSASGTLVSLRCARARGMGLPEMEAAGSVAPRVGIVLRRLVEARANVLVSGATGSGKTTLLAALLGLVPADERIVCIEEVPELAPEHPHAISLVERRANVQGRGAIPLAELVRAAMRMRPDRLVLGECRGPEVRDVLLALNTGHDGGWATIHANGTGDVPARLQALGALAGMSDAALAAQAVAALDAVVHMRRAPTSRSSSAAPSSSSRELGGPGRWVAEIGVLVRSGPDLRCDLALAAERDGTCVEGPGWEGLARVLDHDGALGRAPDDRVGPAPMGAG
ncbi:TadA family conjugal transfer-associated ATPase [Actinomyces culturomici]|uniref:TadA family conjugal transfer-associated ATPase n=1 Tax=Actinomyces culturomici TaxID=1926276 RepID=UPI0015769BDD|nr:TadA family conjugal transfer-associated ATPase [Actinomyces culturomici]